MLTGVGAEDSSKTHWSRIFLFVSWIEWQNVFTFLGCYIL